MNSTYTYYIGGTIVAVVLSALLAFFIFSTGPVAQTPTQTGGSFGSTENTTVQTGTGGISEGGANTPQNTGVQVSEQKIFKISDGPVAGATFVQTLRPTTTLARFVMAENGHAFDLVLDSQGAVPKALSNTTIPGALSTLWVEKGSAAVLQYLDGTNPKTVYLGFGTTSSSGIPTVRLQFYPDGIVGLTGSPDGTQVAYLLRTGKGIDGFTAKTDGTGGKKIFSLPLSEVQLRWPAQGTLLAHTNAAAGVPGIAFAIDAKTGAATPLVYAPGLTATADLTFGHVLYQTSQPGSGMRATYSHDVAQGTDRGLSFNPYPEKCIQHPRAATVLICAAPLAYTAVNYLDLWHQGAASAADSLLSFNLAAGTSTILATPGGQEGGVQTDMLQLAASPDGHYLLFVSKYDRSLWGVRLPR